MPRSSLFMLLFFALALPEFVQGQDVRILSVGDSSTVAISGTSNRSDWSVEAGEFTGTFSVQGSGGGLSVEMAQFSVVGRSIRSQRGVIMNRLMHDALKVGAHPDIVFTMAEIEGGDFTDAGLQMTASGTLSLAGAVQPIEVLLTASEMEDGVRFSGSVEFDMTDWEIKPPTAMFGALHTGKVVTVTFDVLGVPAG